MPHYKLLLEHSPQTQWTDIKFFGEMTCGALGGGLFLAGALVNSGWACVLGFLLACAGKGILLLLDLGQPKRFLRVMLRPFSSWVSFGGWSLMAFAGFGFIYTVAILALDDPAAAGWVMAFKAPAMLFAVIIISYDGLLLASSKAVSAWSSGLLAPLFAANALAAGTSLVAATAAGAALAPMAFIFFCAELLILICHLATLKNGRTGSRASLEIMVTGSQKLMFLGGAVAGGLILPIIILAAGLLGEGGPSPAALAVSGLLAAGGIYCLRVAVLKSGVTTPVL